MFAGEIPISGECPIPVGQRHRIFSGSFLSILIGQSRPASLPPELEMMGTLQKTSTKKGVRRNQAIELKLI